MKLSRFLIFSSLLFFFCRFFYDVQYFYVRETNDEVLMPVLTTDSLTIDLKVEYNEYDSCYYYNLFFKSAEEVKIKTIELKADSSLHEKYLFCDASAEGATFSCFQSLPEFNNSNSHKKNFWCIFMTADPAKEEQREKVGIKLKLSFWYGHKLQTVNFESDLKCIRKYSFPRYSK